MLFMNNQKKENKWKQKRTHVSIISLLFIFAPFFFSYIFFLFCWLRHLATRYRMVRYKHNTFLPFSQFHLNIKAPTQMTNVHKWTRKHLWLSFHLMPCFSNNLLRCKRYAASTFLFSLFVAFLAWFMQHLRH